MLPPVQSILFFVILCGTTTTGTVGATPRCGGGFLWSPLYHAARRDTGILEFLLDTFPDMNVSQGNSRSGWTALHAAVYNGNASAVRALLDANASVAARNIHGETAEDMAKRYNEKAIEVMIRTEVRVKLVVLVLVVVVASESDYYAESVCY